MNDFLQQLLNGLPIPIWYLLAVVLSFIISAYAVRKMIFITRHQKLYDLPDDVRKFHGAQIPSLGGVGIFIGYIVMASILFHGATWAFLLIASILLFFTGIYDDIMNMRPLKKLIAQLLASFIVVVFVLGDKINVFASSFGYVCPIWLSITIATLCCTFFINVYNFIDGIDGLACCLGIVYVLVLGVIFAICGAFLFAYISFTLAGAIGGLLFYNWAPAKIYMGDTGSMLIGLTVFYLFVSLYYILMNGNPYGAILPLFNFTGGIFTILFSLIYFPVFDAIRVFIVRLMHNESPLKADRSHLHYYLLDAGLSHSKAVIIILFINILNFVTGILLRNTNQIIAILIISSELLLITGYIINLRKKNYSKTAKV